MSRQLLLDDIYLRVTHQAVYQHLVIIYSALHIR